MGDDLIISSYYRAHVYRRSGGDWQYAQTVETCTGPTSPFFGNDMVISNGWLALSDQAAYSGFGAAFLYSREASGEWVERAKFVLTDPADGDGYATHGLAIQGDWTYMRRLNDDAVAMYYRGRLSFAAMLISMRVSTSAIRSSCRVRCSCPVHQRSGAKTPPMSTTTAPSTSRMR